MTPVQPCVAGALLVALVGIGLRVLLAPVRWAGNLTSQPAEEDDGYVWWRDDEDRDFGWPELRVAPDPVVSHNGRGTKQEQS